MRRLVQLIQSQIRYKIIMPYLALTIFVTMAGAAIAQETTVMHKETADGMHSKTVVARSDGSKTIIKRHGSNVKKVHKFANGDKVIIHKTAD